MYLKLATVDRITFHSFASYLCIFCLPHIDSNSLLSITLATTS